MTIKNPEASLKKEISRLGFGAIALNGVIGAGIFALPAVAAARTGAFSPWIFLICGVLILTIVLSMARAASFSNETGGPVVYATQAFGPFVGFQTGWLFALSRFSSLAANANLMVTYAAWFWAPIDDGFFRGAAVTFILVALTVFNVIGVRRSMLTIFIFTALKLIPLTALALVGISHTSPGLLLEAGLPEFSSLGETILIVLYAFVGFEGAVVPAGEGKNARRDIPRALFSTVAIITVFYIVIQMVCLAILPELAASKTPLAGTAEILFGPVGATILTLGAFFSIGGNLSASMLSAPRLFYALARDGSLPAWMANIHPTYNTPANAIMLYGALCLVLALSGSFLWLATMSTMVRLFAYGLSIAAIPSLEKTIPEEADQFRLPGGMTIPVIAIVICIWLSTHASMKSWLTMLAFSVAGSILYFLERKKVRNKQSP